jgi:hypothetical protein
MWNIAVHFESSNYIRMLVTGRPMSVGSQIQSDYFSNKSWHDRVQSWLKGHSDDAFLESNVATIRQIMEHSESGLRMVVNISAWSLLSFLAEGRYRNLYETPVIGGISRPVSQERQSVDKLLGFGNHPEHYYFGAAALGGTGVRFYGEYCMAIKSSEIDKDTQILDRDSYDLVLPPISLSTSGQVVDTLKGKWNDDVVDMLTLKVLPELAGANRLITTGTVSELILHDQDFVEIHKTGEILPSSIEEVRQSPDEIAMEARVIGRGNAGYPPTALETLWLQRREQVVQALELNGIRYRMVTLHGRGYQWR